MSDKGLVELSKQNLLGDESMRNLKIWNECALEKFYRLKFKIGKHMSNRLFEYVYVDIWGFNS